MESKDWILLISLAAIWGSAFMFIKISAVDFGPILLVTLRLLIAGLVFMPLLLQRLNMCFPTSFFIHSYSPYVCTATMLFFFKFMTDSFIMSVNL